MNIKKLVKEGFYNTVKSKKYDNDFACKFIKKVKQDLNECIEFLESEERNFRYRKIKSNKKPL